MLYADLSGHNVGTLRRGSSYVPTSQSVTPLPAVVGHALLNRQTEVNKYGRLLRAHAKHFNCDCDVNWNRRRLYIKYRGNVVFACEPTAEAVKNAYCLFRLLDSNISTFLRHLEANEGVVPNVFESETPPHHTGVQMDQDDEIVASGVA
jgi:hypothetical protein